MKTHFILVASEGELDDMVSCCRGTKEVLDRNEDAVVLSAPKLCPVRG